MLLPYVFTRCHPTRLVVLVLLFWSGVAGAQTLPVAPVRYDTDLLPTSFHKGRREEVLKQLPAGSIALFYSAPTRMRGGDTDYEYHQDSDLYYLTGSTEPETVLLLAPSGVELEGRRVREILFVTPSNPSMEAWTGRVFGVERAAKELGFEATASNERFVPFVNALAADSSRKFYTLPLPVDIVAGTQLGRMVAPVRTLARAERVDSRELRSIVTELRAVKQPAEIALMQRAIDITAEAHREVDKAIAPGMYEYQAEALIEYTFRRNGAEDPGFPSIVGSGENATVLHYNTNRRQMQASDLVVMDIGAEYHGYSADITRTVPVGGTFSPEQKAIYELVLQANEAAIKACRAGRQFGEPGTVAARIFVKGLQKLGILDDPNNIGRFMMHGISHHVGLDVHDVHPTGPLKAGNIITIEPGLYFKPASDIDPKWWNIGIRIEDDVLVTSGEPVVLSKAAPKTVAEIEQIMK